MGTFGYSSKGDGLVALLDSLKYEWLRQGLALSVKKSQSEFQRRALLLNLGR